MAYEIPRNLGSLSPDELQALLDEGLEAFHALSLTSESDEATVAEGERIAPLITRVRAEQRSREVVDTGRRNRANAVLQTMSDPSQPGQPGEPEQPEEPGQPGQPGEPGQPGQPEPAEPATPGEGEPVAPDAVIPPPVPVAAGGSPASPARRAAVNAPAIPAPARTASAVSLLAAADVPGIPNGAPLDGLTAAATAVISRMQGLPKVDLGPGVRHRYGAAVIKKDFGGLTQDNFRDDMELLAAVADERRLPGGSLVAAGGWCAPSETLYDLCQFESVDGIIDLPEMGITRGGIRWTQGPDFSDIYDACGFFLTEQQAIDGSAQKDCCMVECPPFEEIRLDAIGLCVKAPLLTQAAYPELTRRFMEGSLVAHQHQINKHLIDTMVAHAGNAATATDVGAISLSLNAIEIMAIGMRYSYRMRQDQSIEVVAPFWLRALLRMDLGMRQMAPAAADAWIASWFSERNLAVQWVYDWQDPVIDGCSVTMPATVDVLLYPAGTWVRGSLDVINVDTLYDSASLQENVYTALFMEEGILAVQRCTRTCRLTIPVCISGRTGAADIADCFVHPTGGDTGTPGPNPATGATAGTPGSWTPAGSDPAASPTSMAGVTASPTSAWTTGQYVQTNTAGTAGRVYWNGTAWIQGTAA